MGRDPGSGATSRRVPGVVLWKAVTLIRAVYDQWASGYARRVNNAAVSKFWAIRQNQTARGDENRSAEIAVKLFFCCGPSGGVL